MTKWKCKKKRYKSEHKHINTNACRVHTGTIITWLKWSEQNLIRCSSLAPYLLAIQTNIWNEVTCRHAHMESIQEPYSHMGLLLSPHCSNVMHMETLAGSSELEWDAQHRRQGTDQGRWMTGCFIRWLSPSSTHLLQHKINTTHTGRQNRQNQMLIQANAQSTTSHRYKLNIANI